MFEPFVPQTGTFYFATMQYYQCFQSIFLLSGDTIGTKSIVNPTFASAHFTMLLTIDGGNTWQYHIGTFPNSGSAIVILPNPDTDIHAARIKVKGNNNVFFNVNSADFTVTHSLSSDSSIMVYPVPTNNVLRIYGGNKGLLNGVIYNSVGQHMWHGHIDGETDIPMYTWARGIYFVRLEDVRNQHTMKNNSCGIKSS